MTLEELIEATRNPNWMNPHTDLPVGEATREAIRKSGNDGPISTQTLQCGNCGAENLAVVRLPGTPSEVHILHCKTCSLIVGTMVGFEPYPLPALWRDAE